MGCNLAYFKNMSAPLKGRHDLGVLALRSTGLMGGAPPAAGLRKGASSFYISVTRAASLRFELKHEGCVFFPS